MERGAKSLADDLGMDRGVVHSRAASSLRSAETNPFDPRDLSALQTGEFSAQPPRPMGDFPPCLVPPAHRQGEGEAAKRSPFVNPPVAFRCDGYCHAGMHGEQVLAWGGRLG